MKDLLYMIVSSIVDYPDQIEIVESDRDGVVAFELHVADSDMGRIIGKNGKTARAIRDLVKAAAIKEHKKVIVDII